MTEIEYAYMLANQARIDMAAFHRRAPRDGTSPEQVDGDVRADAVMAVIEGGLRDGWPTVADIAKALGWRLELARHHTNMLHAAGKLQRVRPSGEKVFSYGLADRVKK